MNLFSFMTGIKAIDCFEYGSSIVFVLQPQMIKYAILNNKDKIKRFGERINRNVKIVALPQNKSGFNMRRFILSVTYPVRFKRISITNNEVTINTSPETKVKLIGRNSVRLIELNSIVKKYFDVKRIIVR